MAASNKNKSPYGLIKFSSIDEYHASFPDTVRLILDELRTTIKQVAPLATEAISYNIPTFKMNKNLVHYAAYEKHIGLYPLLLHLKMNFLNTRHQKQVFNSRLMNHFLLH